MSSAAGSKRRRADGVIVGVRSSREKRRKMECSSPLNAPTKHLSSGRVFNQVKEKPMDEPPSPKKPSRAARLKPQQRIDRVPHKADRVKRQQEKGRFERIRLAEHLSSGRVFNQVKEKPMDEPPSPKKPSRAARLKPQQRIDRVPHKADRVKRQLEKGRFERIRLAEHLSSGRVFNQVKEKPMHEPPSPKKPSSAARLKPQQRINRVPHKADRVKRQQEKGRFERIRLAEDKTKTKADETAARKKAKVELKNQREREREAARIALQKMGRTAGIELNLEIYKELEILSGWSLPRGNPLPGLGLFMKQEYLSDDDEENLKVEHGNILSSGSKVNDGSRKNCPKAQPSRSSSNLPKKSKSSKQEKVVKVAPLNARVPHSGERLLTPISNPQISPKKASRAAMLKSRYANIILKSQQQIVEPVQTQQEYEELERRLAEDKAKIREAEAAAKKKTKIELKKQRERKREREAARIALQQMEGTAGIELNLEIFKELEILSGCSLSRGKPLQELGLFIKQEYLGDEDEEEAIMYEEVEGEILP